MYIDRSGNPALVLRPGKGKPTVRNDYLQQHRDAWIWLLEPHWHEIGWLFEAAENTDQLCHVFEILNSLVNSELIAPFLRKSNEESTVGNVVRVREEHAQAIARLEPLERERREKHSNCEEIKLTVANLSQNAKQNLELDVTIRNGRIRSLRILRSRTQARLRKYLLLKNKSPNPKEICRDWTSYLEGKLRRIEKDIATDETAREESRKRLKWITVDNRKIAAEELDDRKKALARAETALNEASKMCDELQAKLLDQEAFIYRKELCDFIKSRKYAIEPRQIAKALAGLPYMKSRRSAERCLSLSCSIPVMSNYRVFSFVCSRWKRRMERGDRPLVNWFKQEVISLPKWLGKGDDRQENQLRACLTQNWYFLKRAIEQVQALKHSQTPQPYFIAQQFLQNSLNPPVGTDRILADKERISE